MREEYYLRSAAPWVPYKIPPIVERDNPSDMYALGWDHDLADAHPDPTNTNPSQFLKWKKIESRIVHPFAVYLETNQEGVTQAKVELNSSIYTGIGTYSSHNISGLNSLVNATQGYVTVSANVVNNSISGNFSVNWGSSSTNRVTYNGNSEQTYVEARIAYLYTVSGGGWEVRQIAFGNLTVLTGCYDGKPTICLIQT
jgi:hypothetical protein